MGTNLRTSQDIQDDRYIFVPIYFSQKYKKRPPPIFFVPKKKLASNDSKCYETSRNAKKILSKNDPPIFLTPKKSWAQMTPNVMKRPEMQKKEDK